MKIKNIVILLVVVVVIITMFYSFQGSQDDSAYVKEIEREREEKDRFMRNSPESPFAKSVEGYKALRYYPPDIRYRIIANLIPVEQKEPVVLATNDGKEQRYVEYAYAEFKLDGVSN